MIMKMRMIILMLLFVAFTAHGKPMPSSVDSWEGTFKIKSPYLVIHAEGKPKLFLCLYELDKGSKGTCIGFARENGDMILIPKPNTKGIQPIYTGHSVLFGKGDIVEVIVTYDVQGNGRAKLVEKFAYDGKQIALLSRSCFHGKHNPVWKKDEVEQTTTADGSE
jgi:hypothetical protein